MLPQDEKIAAGVVGVLIALVDLDAHRDCREVSEIVRMVNREFNGDDHDAGTLIELATVLFADKAERGKKLADIFAPLSGEERVRVLSIGWRISIADKILSGAETTELIHLRQLLNLSLEQGVLARKLAEESLRQSPSRLPGAGQS